MNWGKLSADVIFRGKDSEGARYLPKFLKDYVSLIEPKEPPIASCKKCINKYLYEFLTYKPKTMKKQNYQLKPKYEGITIFGTGLIITNANITDELGKRLVDEHPAGVKLFAVMPNNDSNDAGNIEDDKDEFTIEYETAIAGKKDDLIDFAEKYEIDLTEATNNELRKDAIVVWYEALPNE